eukprot:TRINITY_DN6231_c0_g1_i1.p1 TRINITY_DN6231_c0_g1~~TRINITY_DN6231_c0_g1_i1.p1  ORF type:complete len:526 (+),score=217.32 TRINITY_DN6231_c0_g1_i1:98-1579(+)
MPSRRIRTSDIPLGLTYDDVLLIPKRSAVKSRRDVHTRTKLSRRIELNIPIVASNMDTVCEVDMAIAMARAGGIGILHRFCSVEEHVNMVRRVKRAQSFLIANPRSVRPEDTVQEALRIMDYDYGAKYGIESLVVTSADGVLKGMLTKDDLQFSALTHDKLVRDVMAPLHKVVVTKDENITPDEAERMMHQNRVSNLPVVDGNGRVTFLITAHDLIKLRMNKGATVDSAGRLRVGAAIGVKKGDLPRAQALVEAGCDCLVIDIAHGHSDLELDMLRLLKADPIASRVDIIAGNICTEEAARDLIAAGADGLKVGVGPGSICITRKVAGSGYPQLSALLELCPYALDQGVPVIADGGVRLSGDVAKAIAAGASTVMLGSGLAGTDESPGSIIVKDGKKVKVVRGMAGFGANISKRERERESQDDIFEMTPEGVEGVVAYKGPVEGILKGMVGGLRSGISYCGATNIKEMQERCDFVRVTPAGLVESGAHDISKM